MRVETKRSSGGRMRTNSVTPIARETREKSTNKQNREKEKKPLKKIQSLSLLYAQIERLYGFLLCLFCLQRFL